MMEVFQFKTNSWFLSRELFIEDPLLYTQQQPIYCHILTGTLAVCLTHKVSTLAIDQHLLQYLQRCKSKNNIIHIYNVTLNHVVRDDATVKVLCQKMCFQVDKIINRLSIQQQFYLIAQIIQNTRILSGSFGFFRITVKMMGLNKNGEFRMWINENHANNSRQFQLRDEQEQFESIIQFLQELRIQNKLINAFINNIITMNLRFKDYPEYQGNFVRMHQLQVKSKVNLSTINVQKKTNVSLQKQLSSAYPSLKSSNATTDMSSSLKKYSLNSRFSQTNVINSNLSQQFSALSKKHQKENEGNGSIISNRLKQKIHNSKSPFNNNKNLINIAQLQESILIQSDDEMKPTNANTTPLQLLGKIGTVCESTTAQELILQQFKLIYQ